MDPIENDVNNSPVVTNSGVVEPAAPAQSVTEAAPVTGVENQEVVVQPDGSQAAPGTKQVLADGTDANKPIPYDRFQEVNAEKDAAVERVKMLENMALQNANPPQTKEPAQPQSMTIQVMKELRFDPEDLLTGEQQAKVNDIVLGRMNAANQAQAQQQSFMSSKPDYANVVGGVDQATQQFAYAPPLQRAMNNNPSIQGVLLSMLRTNPAGAAIVAYEIASKDPTYIKEVAQAAKPAAVQQSEAAQQAIEQANGVVSVSAVAGQGTIDKAAAIRAMSDEQFAQHKQQIMDQAT